MASAPSGEGKKAKENEGKRPEDKDKLYDEGVSLSEKGKYVEAIEYFSKALKIDPKFTDAWRDKGYCYYHLNLFREAIKCHNKAISIDPKYFRAWNSKGLALMGLGMYEEARESYEMAIELMEEKSLHDPYPLINLGDIFYELHEFEEAERCYDKAVELSQGEERAQATNNKAWLFANIGRNEEALTLIEVSLSLRPVNTYSSDTKGYILYNIGRSENNKEHFTEALKWFRLAEVQAGEDKNKKILPRYHRALVHIELKNYNDALERLEEALTINPKFAEALTAKAVVLSHFGNQHQAISELKKAVEYRPSLATAHENLARITLSVKQERQSFWDFWSASWLRSIVAVVLGGIIVYIIMIPIHFGNETIERVEVVDSNSRIVNSTTTTTQDHKIPETYVLVVGIIVLILLIPEIKKAKIGSIELETSHEPLPAQGLSTV